MSCSHCGLVGADRATQAKASKADVERSKMSKSQPEEQLGVLVKPVEHKDCSH